DLSGTVSVTGTVNPAALRSFYLEAGEYDPPDPEAEPFWTPVTLPRREPVVAGLLGEWDTTIFSDGLYQLRVRVLLTTGESRFLVVSPLRVLNTTERPEGETVIAVVPTVEATAAPTEAVPPT